MRTTRAAILREMGAPAPYAQSQPLEIREVQLAPPGAGEVTVRIRAAGLCHSDLSVINGSRPRVMPMVLGHEAAGEVVEVGPNPGGLKVGDHVVFSFVPVCGECPACSEGRPAMCAPGAVANGGGSLLSGARPFADDQCELHHHLGVSAFADYTTVSAKSCVAIDSTLDFRIAALFGCAVMTGVGAVVNTAKVEPGTSCAVYGLGGVGLAALIGARASGANPLVAIDLSDDKLALARSLGATHTVNAGDADALEQVRAITNGGARTVVESVGSAKVLETAYAATGRAGTTVTVGLPHPDARLDIQAVSLTVDERVLRGSYMGSAIPSRDIPRFIAMYQAGLLPVDKLLSHTLKLEEINEAFDVLDRGEAVRQVIVFD